ncbi:MAG: DUF2800 domain-containing protein [Kiritimatiellae bacterium]|nr:DUF2800 domain-containing protein [Kiritimatiellia bacterium]
MTDHAKHSPSSLKAKSICPHWQNTGETSAAAEEGTALHRACETGDLAGLNEEQTHSVRMCLDYVRPLIEGGISVHREQRLDVAGLTFGTADLIVMTGDNHAHVIDFKFGRVKVDDAEQNLQGFAYALGAMNECGVEHVTVHFLQPRCDTVSVARFSRQADGQRLYDAIHTVILNAENPAAPFRPAPDNCRFCGAHIECPALREKALTVYQGYAEDALPIPAEFHPSNIADPRQMAVALQLAPVLEKWAESVRKHAMDMVKGGAEIPGYELRFRTGKRTVRDVVEVWTAIEGRLGITQLDYLQACTISLPQLEKIVAEHQEKGGGAAAKRKLTQLLQEAGVVVPGEEVEYLAKAK